MEEAAARVSAGSVPDPVRSLLPLLSVVLMLSRSMFLFKKGIDWYFQGGIEADGARDVLSNSQSKRCLLQMKSWSC